MRVRSVCLKRSIWVPALVLMLAGPGALAGQAAPIAAQAESPLEFSGYVVDRADLLDAATRQRLTDRLGRFERETGHQFAVVTVASLAGEDIATFTRRLANRWGVGRKGIDDGIVLLVAPHERKVRIAVGFGLQEALPDAFCAEIVANAIIPAFAHGAFAEGIDAGVSAIIGRLRVGISSA